MFIFVQIHINLSDTQVGNSLQQLESKSISFRFVLILTPECVVLMEVPNNFCMRKKWPRNQKDSVWTLLKFFINKVPYLC